MKANLEPVFRARRRGVFTQIVKILRRRHNLYFHLGEVAVTAESEKTRSQHRKNECFECFEVISWSV